MLAVDLLDVILAVLIGERPFSLAATFGAGVLGAACFVSACLRFLPLGLRGNGCAGPVVSFIVRLLAGAASEGVFLCVFVGSRGAIFWRMRGLSDDDFFGAVFVVRNDAWEIGSRR